MPNGSLYSRLLSIRERWGLVMTGENLDRECHELWARFTRLMARLLTAQEVKREVAEFVAEVSDATSSAVYLMDPGDMAFRLNAQVGSALFTVAIEETGPLPSWLRLTTSPVALTAEFLPTLSVPALPAVLAVPIRWRATLLGFILLGPPRSQMAFTPEQLGLLVTVAQQYGAAIMLEHLSVRPDVQSLDCGTTTAIHDIKNSVSALSLLARNALRNFSEPEFQRDAIATILRTVERMQRVLATLSSREPVTSLAIPEPIDLQALIIEATTPLAADPRVRLVRRLAPVSSFFGDRDALLRMLENLSTNAVEAIGNEGTVTVILTEEHGHAVIVVADTGCGLSDDYRERHLFSPFHSTKKNGWGVGLYQTKQVVERQAGTIHVDSVEGRGTTFTVKLPLGAPVESACLESAR